jgi:hypothetical protein
MLREPNIDSQTIKKTERYNSGHFYKGHPNDTSLFENKEKVKSAP